MRTLVCRYCGRTILANKKLKHLLQQYCGDKICQADRKLRFERHKYKTNELFRSNKLQKVRYGKKKQAVQGNPLGCSMYQRDYRASHPDYVFKNRQQQRQRNARNRVKTIQETKIVNPDTLMLQHPDNYTVYAMIAVDYKKIVNPDTFMSQLADMESITKAQTMFVRRL
jgi:outer membrane protein assembly factor BamE (lipoprotein component of BamABCDE complex)